MSILFGLEAIKCVKCMRKRYSIHRHVTCVLDCKNLVLCRPLTVNKHMFLLQIVGDIGAVNAIRNFTDRF